MALAAASEMIAMSYVFISHASVDKRKLVRPVVEALVKENIKIWVDRPGYGENHLELDQSFITRHDLRYLRSGDDWDGAIMQAIQGAGAVLACISRAFSGSRQVLWQEVLLGCSQGKLVACIVDDLPYDQIPADLGLLNGQKIHAERVKPALLRRALDALERRTVASPEDLPTPLRSEWEVVRKLKQDMVALFPVLPEATAEEWHAACQGLAEYPVFPLIRPHEIPPELIELLAVRFREPDRATHLTDQAMRLRKDVNREGGTDRQILVTAAERLHVHSVTPEEYWASLVTLAGLKSPRTLAALFLAPHAPHPNQLSEALRLVHQGFLEWLRAPEMTRAPSDW